MRNYRSGLAPPRKALRRIDLHNFSLDTGCPPLSGGGACGGCRTLLPRLSALLEVDKAHFVNLARAPAGRARLGLRHPLAHARPAAGTVAARQHSNLRLGLL